MRSLSGTSDAASARTPRTASRSSAPQRPRSRRGRRAGSTGSRPSRPRAPRARARRRARTPTPSPNASSQPACAYGRWSSSRPRRCVPQRATSPAVLQSPPEALVPPLTTVRSGALAEEPARVRLLGLPRRPAQAVRLEQQRPDRVLDRLARPFRDELAEHEVAEVRVVEAVPAGARARPRRSARRPPRARGTRASPTPHRAAGAGAPTCARAAASAFRTACGSSRSTPSSSKRRRDEGLRDRSDRVLRVRPRIARGLRPGDLAVLEDRGGDARETVLLERALEEVRLRQARRAREGSGRSRARCRRRRRRGA